MCSVCVVPQAADGAHHPPHARPHPIAHTTHHVCITILSVAPLHVSRKSILLLRAMGFACCCVQGPHLAHPSPHHRPHRYVRYRPDATRKSFAFLPLLPLWACVQPFLHDFMSGGLEVHRNPHGYDAPSFDPVQASTYALNLGPGTRGLTDTDMCPMYSPYHGPDPCSNQDPNQVPTHR